MHRLQEVVRLHRLGKSSRAIARQLRMGRDTIRGYLRALRRAGVLDGLPEDLPEFVDLRGMVEEHAPSKVAPQQTSSVEEWTPKIKAFRGKGVKPTAIHDWLRQHQVGYDGSLSAVKRMCLRLEREDESSTFCEIAAP